MLMAHPSTSHRHCGVVAAVRWLVFRENAPWWHSAMLKQRRACASTPAQFWGGVRPALLYLIGARLCPRMCACVCVCARVVRVSMCECTCACARRSLQLRARLRHCVCAGACASPTRSVCVTVLPPHGPHTFENQLPANQALIDSGASDWSATPLLANAACAFSAGGVHPSLRAVPGAVLQVLGRRPPCPACSHRPRTRGACPRTCGG